MNANFQAKMAKAMEILINKMYMPVSKKTIIIFVIGATGAGKSTFLNKAISDDVMAVNHLLAASVGDVESIKCTSPWNPSGRSIIFAEIPAFSFGTAMQKKITESISRWLNRIYCPEGPVDSGIIYLHSMASQRVTEDFAKHLNLFVTLCRASGHRPTCALLVSTMWSATDSTADMATKTRELEEHFRNSAPPSIRPIPDSVRFDESRISACKAINSLILEIEQDVNGTTESVSITDTIIFVLGSTGAGKSTFINTAISENVMTVSHSLASHVAGVRSARCASPWNLSGRSIIFVEIPAFNHSDRMMQTRIPDLISRWLKKTACPEGPVNSGIIYLHSMASHRMNEGFKKYLDPFVKICYECGHKPTSVLLVSTLWSDESEAEVYEMTTELEGHFQRAASSIAIHPISYSVRFDESQVSACDAVDILMLDMQ